MICRVCAIGGSILISSTIILLFTLFYGLFPTFKAWVNDYECATAERLNGVSGHCFYLLMYAVILSYYKYLIRMIDTDIPLIGLTIAQCILLYTGCITYYYGYHTLKQMVYGSLLGIPFGLLLTAKFDITFKYLFPVKSAHMPLALE